MKKIGFLLVLLISMSIDAQQQNNSIAVIGEGIIKVVPDKVIIRARVEHTGNSPSEVKRQNDQVIDKIFSYLKSRGIPSENVQSEYINLNKEYNYNLQEYTFSANQAISIRLDDLDQYEDLMSGLLESGLNRIDGIQFQTSKKEELKKEARRKAVMNAQEKATELAGALDQRIGKAVQISEVGEQDFLPVYRTMEMKSDESGSSQTIAPGEMEISAKVNVVFQLY